MFFDFRSGEINIGFDFPFDLLDMELVSHIMAQSQVFGRVGPDFGLMMQSPTFPRFWVHSRHLNKIWGM